MKQLEKEKWDNNVGRQSAVPAVQSVESDIHCPIKDKISSFVDPDIASW